MTVAELAPVTDPGTLRQTRLGQFDKCRRSAYLGLKYPDQRSIAMDRGTAFHAVAERGIQMLVEQGEMSMPGEVATELADAIMVERLDLVLSAEEQDAVRLMAHNWAGSTVINEAEIVGVEVPLAAEVAGREVTGKIDLIEIAGSTLYIKDYKTSLNVRGKEEVEKGFQGQLYAFLVMFGVHRETRLPISAGITDVFFYEVYPRYTDDNGQMIAREASWSRAELVEFGRSLERNVLAFEDELQGGDWPATDGSWCSQCPAQSECPIPADLREMPEVANVAQAEDAFSYKLWLEKESRRVQSALRGWVQENGPVYRGDLAFDAIAQEVRKVKDWDGLLTALVRSSEFGVPFEVTDHVDLRTQTKFGKRKVTNEERDGD